MEVNFRRCVSCRRVAHRQEFFRVVRDHLTHSIQINGGEGRSVYVCPTEHCLIVAQKKKKLSRSLKATVPDGIFLDLFSKISS